MKSIHFVSVQEPDKVLVAIDDGVGYYVCEISYEEEDGSVRTQTHCISQDTVDYMTREGFWRLLKVNGVAVQDLNRGFLK